MNYNELEKRVAILESKVIKNEFMKGLIGKVGMKKADWEDLADSLNDADVGFNMHFEVDGNNITGTGFIKKRPRNDTFTIIVRDTKTANKLTVAILKNGKQLEEVKGLRPKQILSTVSQMIRDFCEDCTPVA
jgi:hypothetical protein